MRTTQNIRADGISVEVSVRPEAVLRAEAARIRKLIRDGCWYAIYEAKFLRVAEMYERAAGLVEQADNIRAPFEEAEALRLAKDMEERLAKGELVF